ncbi:hypothetical protein K438DRAFT_1764967 [Mycena galopus ATCC 62051]|nr:hypothetical protein K438DRAFT_1764967 [Mycena galopus ATCC 62051]
MILNSGLLQMGNKGSACLAGRLSITGFSATLAALLVPNQLAHRASRTPHEFSEFNHYKNETDECTRIPGPPLVPDGACAKGEECWIEGAYRKISYSHCEGGEIVDLTAVSLQGIQLSDDDIPTQDRAGRAMTALKAIPSVLIRIVGVPWAWTASRLRRGFKNQRGDIALSMGEDEE